MKGVPPGVAPKSNSSPKLEAIAFPSERRLPEGVANLRDSEHNARSGDLAFDDQQSRN
jgi:hypothetical protein